MRSKQFMTYILLCTPLIAVSHAQAAEMLTNVEIFAKCHAKISDHPVETTSAEYKDVAAGKLNPVTACINLLNKAMFTKNQAANAKSRSAELNKSIVRNFHATWLVFFFTLRNHLRSIANGARQHATRALHNGCAVFEQALQNYHYFERSFKWNSRSCQCQALHRQHIELRQPGYRDGADDHHRHAPAG